MLDLITAVRFDGRVQTGRTVPCRLTCENAEGVEVEVVAKFSAGCDVTARSKDARPYIHAEFMKTWRKMEELVDLGLVRHIGTSNMTVPKLKLLLRDARIKPAVNEMELHPHFQQPQLFDFVRSNGMVPVGYSPVGSPGRPERDRTAEDTVPTQDAVIA